MRRGLPVRTSPPLTFAAWLRHDSIRRMLEGLEGVESVLEVGAGEGALAVRLASAYDYVGFEPDPTASAKAEARLLELGRGRLVRALEELAPDTRFDLVCAFEVLEHLADEVVALETWRLRLRGGGWLLLSVPAGAGRYGAADRRVGHYRRYEPARLARVLGEAGFALQKIERVGLPLGYWLEALRHGIARAGHRGGSPEARSSASGRWLQPPDSLGWATRAVTAPFRALEARLPAHRPGTNLVVLARTADVGAGGKQRLTQTQSVLNAGNPGLRPPGL